MLALLAPGVGMGGSPVGAVVAPTTPALHPVSDRAPAESRRPLLAIRLRGPGREWSVLGSDDARGIVAEGFTATADRGGPVTCAFNLRRDPTVVYPDLGAFSELDAEVGNQLLFGGRVWELPGTRGAERSLSVSARGWQSHLEDDVLTRFWVHSAASAWRDMRSYPGQNLTYAAASPSVTSVGGCPSFGWPNNSHCAHDTGVGLMLDLGPGRTAKRVVVNWNVVNGNAAFTLYARTHDTEDTFTGTFTNGFVVPMEAATTFQSATFSTARRYVSLFLYRDDGITAVTGTDHYVQIYSIKVFAATSYESGNDSTLRASDVVRDMLTSGSLPLLSSSTERITTSGLVDSGTKGIPHFDTGNGGGYQSPRQVIDAANAYQSWNAGVDARKRLFFEPRSSLPICELGEWSGAEFSDQSTASAETLYNRVIVQGQDGSGNPVNVIRTATVPALDLMGVTRTMVLQVSAILTQGSAAFLGDAWLSEKARSQFKGSLRIVGMGSVRDLASGRPMHPSELLRLTGQMIRISHLIDPDTGGQGRDAIIAQVQYAHDDESASISLDNENGRLDALLARVGALQAVNA